MQGEGEAGTRRLREDQVTDSGKQRTEGHTVLAVQMEKEVIPILRECTRGSPRGRPATHLPFCGLPPAGHDIGSWQCLPASCQMAAVDPTMLTAFASIALRIIILDEGGL